MPAQVSGSSLEILTTAPPSANALGSVVEVLVGSPGVIPTQQASIYMEAVEVLTTAATGAGALAQVSEILWRELEIFVEMDAEVIEVLTGSPGVIPTQQSSIYVGAVEVLTTAQDSAALNADALELLVSYGQGVAAVSDISGPSVTLATFDGTASIGFISAYKWNWVSVPVGSLVANTAQPYPDFGATSPIDMTSNAVLYHAEEVAGTSGFDTSGSGNTAALTAITVGVGGQVGSFSWQFTGSTSRVTPAAPVAIPGDYTIAFWFKGLAPDSGWRTGARGLGSWYHIIVESGGANRLGLYTGGFRTTDTGYSMAAASFTGWHHLVSVGTGGNTEFYIDAIHVGTVIGYQSTDSIQTLGNYNSGNQRFADFIDELAIWNRALTSTEIADIFTLQSGNFAGVGSMFTFLPDEDGTYTVNLTVIDGLNGVQTVDTADAVIGAGSLLFPLQGDSIRMWAHLQGASLLKRGQK